MIILNSRCTVISYSQVPHFSCSRETCIDCDTSGDLLSTNDPMVWPVTNKQQSKYKTIWYIFCYVFIQLLSILWTPSQWTYFRYSVCQTLLYANIALVGIDTCTTSFWLMASSWNSLPHARQTLYCTPRWSTPQYAWTLCMWVGWFSLE